jgi:hypothetical protein
LAEEYIDKFFCLRACAGLSIKPATGAADLIAFARES